MFTVITYKKETARAADYESASDAVRTHIEALDLGSREWYGSARDVGAVYLDGSKVAQVHYNGRVELV